MISVTFEEAQKRLDPWLDTAQHEPVCIIRHGRPAAFVISPLDMEDLLDAQRRRSEALADFEAYFAQADARLTPAARALGDEGVRRLVRESR